MALRERPSHRQRTPCTHLTLFFGAALPCCTAQAPERPRAPAPRAEIAEATGGDVSTNAPAPSVAVVNPGACPAAGLVDDTEDGDARILHSDERDGSWFTYEDEAGSTITPPPDGPFTMAQPGANGSKHSARMRGEMANGPVWVGMGLELAQNGKAYDASCCSGISFWGRKQGVRGGDVRFKVGDAQTVPEGGICTDCYNDFGVDLGFTEEWREYTLSFDRMTQQSGWGQRFDSVRADAIYHLHWQVNHPRRTYDIWIDDVALWGCTSEAAAQQ